MSDIIANNIGTSRWNMPDGMFRRIKKFRNKTFQAPFESDSADQCWLGREYWHGHPVSDFEYKFNNWACRDNQDYGQYLKENTDQKVNLCIGDSFTVNIGGPQEHSWPALLAQRSGVPSINLAHSSLSSYYFQDHINRVKNLVNVNNVFVLYNVLDDIVLSDSEMANLINIDLAAFEQKIMFLKKHCWVHDAYWQFDPPNCFSNIQRQKLYRHFPEAHDFIKNVKFNLQEVDINMLLTSSTLRQKYQELSGPAWPEYEKFCQQALQQQNILKLFSNSIDVELFQEFMRNHFLPAAKVVAWGNRDGLHMNKRTNQMLADYFYQQSLAIKPIALLV